MTLFSGTHCGEARVKLGARDSVVVSTSSDRSTSRTGNKYTSNMYVQLVLVVSTHTFLSSIFFYCIIIIIVFSIIILIFLTMVKTHPGVRTKGKGTTHQAGAGELLLRWKDM